MANLSNINGKFVVEQTTGYVGVGTTDPNYPIEVLNASAEIALNASGGSIYRLRSTSSDSFIITKNGVGDRLTIAGNGDATFAGSVEINNSLLVNVNANNKGIQIANSFALDNASTFLYLAGKNTAGTFKTGQLELLHDGSLNLRSGGSGTTTAYGSTALTIDTSQNATFLGDVNVHNASTRIISLNYEDGINSIISHSGTNFGLESLNVRGDNIRFYTDYDASTPKGNLTLTLDTDHNATFAGNVGIGISPGENLHIFKSDATALIQASNTSGIAQLQFFPRDGSNVAHLQSIKGVDSSLTFLTGGNSGNSYVPTERLRIDSSGNSTFAGNVGIGVTSHATASLNITNTAQHIRLNNGSELGIITLDTDGKLDLWAHGTDETINFRTGTGSGTVTMSVVGSNVGIGTTSPTSYSGYSTLALNGTNGGLLEFKKGDVQQAYIANAGNPLLQFVTNGTEKMRIASNGAIGIGGTNYGSSGEVLTSNGNAAPSWQAAGGSAWPQEKMAVYTINSTTSNILIATMNSTTWHGNFYGGCLKFTINDTDYIQVSYVTIYTFLSGTNKWFFKGNTEMTTHNTGTNPIRYVFAFSGAYGSHGPTCTLKINRSSNGGLGPVNVLVQAISSPDMFILN